MSKKLKEKKKNQDYIPSKEKNPTKKRKKERKEPTPVEERNKKKAKIIKI